MRITPLAARAATLAVALPLAFFAVAHSSPPPAPRVQVTASQRLSFDFKDPKGVNALGFLLDSTLEPIFGTGTAIEGSVEFDPADPSSARGTLRMQSKALRTTNDMMTTVMHGPDWLDVANHPLVQIELVRVVSAEPLSGSSFKLQAEAEVTIRGKTLSVTVPVLASYLPGRLGDRMKGATGDLLVLRSRFIVKRSDFDINVASPVDVVADEILITAAITGMRKTG